MGGDAGADMHRDTTNVLAPELDLARVNPTPDLKSQELYRIAKRPGAVDRARRTVECAQRPIADELDRDPAEALNVSADDLVVPVEQGAPRTVAELGSTSCRADDVGEHDGRQQAVRKRMTFACGQQLGDIRDAFVAPVTSGIVFGTERYPVVLCEGLKLLSKRLGAGLHGHGVRCAKWLCDFGVRRA